MTRFILLLISLYILTLINAQTPKPTYNPTTAPTIAPTVAPTLSPIICRHHGRKNETCNNRTVTPTKAPVLPTSPTTPGPLRDGGHTKMPTAAPLEYTLSPTLPTPSPTEHPLVFSHDEDETFAPTKSSPTKAPTHMPLTYDLDTNYPSPDPSKAPTEFGETKNPTQDSPDPTESPSAAPTKSPSDYPTKSPTLKPSEAPTKDAQVQETEDGVATGNGNGNGNEVEMSAADEVLLDLTSILLIVFGILICGILCGIFYYWWGRKRAVKRAQALQFRFNANRQMELDRVKSNTMSDKRTNLLMNMGHDGPIRVPDDAPGGIDTNDIVILSPQTNDPALDLMLETKGGGDDGEENKYLNVNDTDEFDDNVTDPMVDKITDNGMEINMNEDGMDDEIIDDIDNNDYVTAGGEDINMDETDEES